MDAAEGLRRAFRDVPLCRIATVGVDGSPLVASRWFVWLEDALYVATRQGGATWMNAEIDRRVSVVIDRGRDWIDLAGVRIDGTAELLAGEHPGLRDPMSAFHEKYRPSLGGEGFERFTASVPVLGFLRIPGGAVKAWDHRTGT